ncbi:MAG: zf-TFIIB domain-containing protein [Phycisphaeraceae bacterium]|nr:MAG: zf-TFIIB domain-containing protein [Phycisphaeraceae bacterium]
MDLTPKGKIRCPKCATIMEKMPVTSTLEVEHCGRCGALWFDPYELESTLRADGGSLGINAIDYGTAQNYDLQVHGDGSRQCPRDASPLVKVPDPRQPHVIIDVCRTCGGVLLDAGELKDLSEFTLSERLKAFLRR